MNKIQKNINAIEQKFYSLKTANQLFDQPIPISEFVETITSGALQRKEVEEYLQYVHSSPDIMTRQKINEKWYELGVQELFVFLDKVVKYRNFGKSKQLPLKQNSSQNSKKKKIKQLTSEVHENPFIPVKITTSTKKSIQKSLENIQKDKVKNKIYPVNKIKEDSKDEYFSSLLLLMSKSMKQSEVSQPSSESKTKQIISDLPQNFQNLTPKQKYRVLSKKYGSDKIVLQKKFDSIYKHYRKEMFIPFESFQINNDLLMDLRIFLKYYRQFQVSKKFKTNQAIKNFKKIGLNGLWLDDRKFIEIHYQLANLLEVDSKTLGETIEGDIDEIDAQKGNEAKMQISKKNKNLVQNIINIKQLSDLISEEKINEIFNNKKSKNTIKKIVEVHSGLTKDDVMLKLQERNEERKLKKNFLLEVFNQQRLGHLSPEKVKTSKILEDPTLRLSPSKQSVYDELQMPKLRQHKMKKLSIYSSLQTLNIQKEKEKLKSLINERENEKYLDAFFKKEKQIFNLPRSQSMNLSKNPTQNQESTNGFTIDSTKPAKNINREILFQRNLSLPRMKFN